MHNKEMNSTGKKATKNVVASVFNQIFSIVLGLIIPRLVLVKLGSEANGLLGSINQILAYVSLLDAGIATASLQALYKGFAHNDKTEINGIISATNIFFRRTGRLYFVAVCILSVLFPFTIRSELPKFTIFVVVLFSGLPGVIVYYFQGKYKVLLEAEGKKYISTNVATVVHFFTSVSKIVLLLLGFGIIELQLMYFLVSIMQMFFYVAYVRKNYQWLNMEVEPDFESISQRRNVAVHYLSYLVFSNTDMIILTYACGLEVVSVYAMYTMLFEIIKTLISHFSSITFILGQTFHQDKEKFIQMLDVYENVNMTLTFSLFCVTNIFILPFLKLYTAGVAGISYIDKYLPYLFIGTYLLTNARTASQHAIDIAQHFKETQNRAILEMFINIIVSLLAVWKWGIYGVIIGTIVALLYRSNDVIIYANRKILHRSCWPTYKRWLTNFGVFTIITIIMKYIFSTIELENYMVIIVSAGISCFVIVPLFFGMMFITDREVTQNGFIIFKNYIKGMLQRIK